MHFTKIKKKKILCRFSYCLFLFRAGGFGGEAPLLARGTFRFSFSGGFIFKKKFPGGGHQGGISPSLSGIFNYGFFISLRYV